MANLRDLKKEIRKICADLAGECLIARNCIPGVDMNKIDDIIVRTADLQGVALGNVSFSFDRLADDFPSGREYHKARRRYYRKAYASFREKFLGHVTDLVHELNSALPKPARELKCNDTDKA